ncbi:MAG: hemerythrin HHE cation-binding protein [Betaproteobacteria bacterium HGW-Betaproteobacteria-10]|nr:MAG: hemerythrin HHE cation-binding protein [Betaproteobacteria bacterium HGW-Betaproteobacteria-10]
MKRSPVLLTLSREHHRALVLALRIARCHDGAGQAALRHSVPRIFRDELVPHFQEEEQGVLPQLVMAGESALVQRTLEEHRQMRDLVARLESGDLSSLKPFAILLKAHIQFEERELFATAQAVLPSHYLDQHD